MKNFLSLVLSSFSVCDSWLPWSEQNPQPAQPPWWPASKYPDINECGLQPLNPLIHFVMCRKDVAERGALEGPCWAILPPPRYQPYDWSCIKWSLFRAWRGGYEGSREREGTKEGRGREGEGRERGRGGGRSESPVLHCLEMVLWEVIEPWWLWSHWWAKPLTYESYITGTR